MIKHPDASRATVLSRPTGPLGFGCGLLSLAGDRKSAVRLIKTAFDNGIVYFDTARLYAEGLAEGMLGEALFRQRDQVILTSKAGILPTSRSLARRISDKAVHLARKVPPLRTVLPVPKAAEPTFNVFDVPSLRKSVETSLRELKTDHLDILLLHECTARNVADADIRAFAEDLLSQGKIRSYGVAPSPENFLEIERQGIAFGEVVQIADSACDETASHMSKRDSHLLITHSVLGERFRDTIEKLRGDQAAAARWHALLDMDPLDEAALAGLFLGHALHRNPSGIVLFSTTNPQRIRQNLRYAQSPLPAAQIHRLAEALEGLRQETS